MNNKLREVRFMKRVSQWKLAILSGVPQTKVSLIENGYVVPRDDEKKRISKALSVSQNEIWGGGNGQEKDGLAN